MVKVLIVGFGTVGQGFFELLNKSRIELGLDARITEIIDLKYGHISNPAPGIIEKVRSGNVVGTRVDIDDVPRLIEESDADVMCELTWVNVKSKGEPAFTHIVKALSSGKHVITTNKGPIAFHYDELIEISRRYNRLLRFKGTVMSGTPSFNILELLPGAHVESFMGILNGTTNFILTRMSEGSSFEEALAEAQRLGYAEADPSLDIDGVDAALKTIIVSRVIGWRHRLEDMEVRGIRGLGRGQGVVKLVSYADRTRAFVKPMQLDRDDVLANVRGSLNAIKFKLDTLGEVVIIGPGAGRYETAQAVLTDLVYIIRHMEDDEGTGTE